MSVVFNLATERARRETDRVLDAVDRIRVELEAAQKNETATRLHDLADRLAHVGITMLAASAVMAENFEHRLRASRSNARSQTRCAAPNRASDSDQRSML